MISKVGEMPLLIVRRHRVTLLRLCIPVEVLCIDKVSDSGDPGWRDATADHHSPVDTSEPLVLLNFLCSVPSEAKSEAAISTQETLDEVASFWLDVRRELVVPIHDLLVDSHRVVIVEGWVAGEHLED